MNKQELNEAEKRGMEMAMQVLGMGRRIVNMQCPKCKTWIKISQKNKHIC